MQFQVPQFIEVEDKIFGPLTFRQFVFIAGGLGFAFVLYRVLPLILAAPLIAGVGGLAAALAFFQFNGRPFILAMENAFYYFIHPKLYLWDNEHKKREVVKKADVPTSAAAALYVPHLSESKLHDLAWSLDIQERIAAGTAGDDEREGGVVSPVRVPSDLLQHLGARR